ncbi:Glycosyltransferase involved in cell wall bisynthesis [Marinobacter daqiaonensis]|uniref:Glycosyltransferase involved in cell wall bisynthesis n=1 Tax=Marinobacter daqiaonensis TaxID=650891 RepID=A0A1I6H0A4_9GAMM|nr:glycosyltransferase family 4 protein [Marinobacter daqiaonensis]SFR47884.1 Glycosyltransferase involved in cell wall bisynthesis [Marinobacter daqiaonensis]
MASSEPAWNFVVPGDPEQRTGGYGYVRELVNALNHHGQPATIQSVEGRFPLADDQATAALDAVLASHRDGATVIVDGLALGGCPGPASRHGQRLNLVALVHHPLADEAGLSAQDARYLFDTERRALAAVHRVITTSRTTSDGLDRYGVAGSNITVIEPGVHLPPMSGPRQAPEPGRPLRLLCLAHLSPRKAQHRLVEALATIQEPSWYCELAGSPDRDPAYARHVAQRITDFDLNGRVTLSGELSGEGLERAFQEADLFVLPSEHEGYGMVIDEALARGLPVISSDGGALARTADRPGCVVYPHNDTRALARLLAARLMRPALLQEQREGAWVSRSRLRSWGLCARECIQALSATAPEDRNASVFDADWLELREPADHQARSETLTRLAIDWLAGRGVGDPILVDIGTGTGSNCRYLAPRLSENLTARSRWHLYDQDAGLLEVARCSLPPEATSQFHLGRLTVAGIDVALPAWADLITASALIDLVSEDWLDALATCAARRKAALLIVLSYAGHFELTPAHPRDQALRDLVNAHQHGDKGLGSAQGPRATDCLAGHLRALGYRVTVESSPWQLGGDHQALQLALIAGWVQAAREQAGGDGTGEPGWLDEWHSTRTDQVRRGELAIRVDHQDVFGEPGC